MLSFGILFVSLVPSGRNVYRKMLYHFYFIMDHSSVGRVEARNTTCIDCGYHVVFRASTRPTEEWSKNN